MALDLVFVLWLNQETDLYVLLTIVEFEIVFACGLREVMDIVGDVRIVATVRAQTNHAAAFGRFGPAFQRTSV